MNKNNQISLNKYEIMSYVISNALYGSSIYDKKQEKLIEDLTKILINKNKTIKAVIQELYNILGPYTEITSFLYEQVIRKVYIILLKKEMSDHMLSSLIYTLNDENIISI